MRCNGSGTAEGRAVGSDRALSSTSLTHAFGYHVEGVWGVGGYDTKGVHTAATRAHWLHIYVPARFELVGAVCYLAVGGGGVRCGRCHAPWRWSGGGYRTRTAYNTVGVKYQQQTNAAWLYVVKWGISNANGDIKPTGKASPLGNPRAGAPPPV